MYNVRTSILYIVRQFYKTILQLILQNNRTSSLGRANSTYTVHSVQFSIVEGASSSLLKWMDCDDWWDRWVMTIYISGRIAMLWIVKLISTVQQSWAENEMKRVTVQSRMVGSCKCWFVLLVLAKRSYIWNSYLTYYYPFHTHIPYIYILLYRYLMVCKFKY